MNLGDAQKTRKQKSKIQFTRKNKKKFLGAKTGLGSQRKKRRKKSEASLGDREAGYDGWKLFFFFFRKHEQQKKEESIRRYTI